MPDKIYKLTKQDQTTRDGFYYPINKWKRARGSGVSLCSDGYLHAYRDPLVAVFLNPTHANIVNPILWEAEGAGASINDGQLKCGYKKLRIVKQIPLPIISTEQYVEIGIRCALTIYKIPSFILWAENWLSGKDRSAAAARAWAEWEAAAARAWAARAAEVNKNLDLIKILHSVIGV